MRIERKVYARFILAASEGSEDFIKMVEAQLKLDGRRIQFDNLNNLAGPNYSTVYINFYNLEKPRDSAHAENNRMLFSVDGFGKEDPHAPPPTGKVKINGVVCALPREYRLRGKSGTPAQIAKYFADHINKIVREVEPTER